MTISEIMDRKKQTAAESLTDMDRQFLEKNGVSTQITDCLTLLLENRPKDPLNFLAEYFASANEEADKVMKAHEMVTLVHCSRPAYEINLRAAYDLLCTACNDSQAQVYSNIQPTDPPQSGQGGITGEQYMALFTILCKDFPAKVQDSLRAKLMCRDYELVVLAIFRTMVMTCLVLKDAMKLAGDLFSSLDTQQNNQVDSHICDAINAHLCNALSKTAQSPISILSAGTLLTPDKVYSSVKSNMFSNRNTKSFSTKEQFLVNIANTCITQVAIIK